MAPSLPNLFPKPGLFYLITHAPTLQALVQLLDGSDAGKALRAVVAVQVATGPEMPVSILYLMEDGEVAEKRVASEDMRWLDEAVAHPTGSELASSPSGVPLMSQILRHYAESSCAPQARLPVGSPWEQAPTVFRTARGDAGRFDFLRLLPKMMVYEEVGQGLFRDWLLAFRKKPQVPSDQVVSVRMRDTYLEQRDRVEVEYGTSAGSFTCYFTPQKIDDVLSSLRGVEEPHRDLGPHVPYLSEQARWKLNRLWASSDKASDRYMPHELCNALGIDPEEAHRVMESLVQAGVTRMYVLAYHTCMEPPVKAAPAEAGIKYPFDCPECDGEIHGPAQLRFSSMIKRVSP